MVSFYDVAIWKLELRGLDSPSGNILRALGNGLHSRGKGLV